MKQHLLTYITIGFVNFIYAQKKTENQNLLWTRYSLEVKINDQWQVKQELEERTYWFPWRQHQFLSRTLINRKFNKGWNVSAGVTYFIQSLPHDPYVKKFTNNDEIRLQIELGNKQKISDKFSIGHRYWSEFRFFEQSDSKFEFENIRMRYRLEFQYLLVNKITLKASDEIFLNIGNKITYNVFDQNRYGTSLQYMPLNDFGIEIGYINWFQQRKSGDEFYNRNIVRFTLHHNISFNKSKKT